MATEAITAPKVKWGDIPITQIQTPKTVATLKQTVATTNTPQNKWQVVAPKQRKKKKVLKQIEMNPTDWKDEFTEIERHIYNQLKSVFPNGLTADQLAVNLNTNDPTLQISAKEVGNYLYGDQDDVSDELARYVFCVDWAHRPR